MGQVVVTRTSCKAKCGKSNLLMSKARSMRMKGLRLEAAFCTGASYGPMTLLYRTELFILTVK